MIIDSSVPPSPNSHNYMFRNRDSEQRRQRKQKERSRTEFASTEDFVDPDCIIDIRV